MSITNSRPTTAESPPTERRERLQELAQRIRGLESGARSRTAAPTGAPFDLTDCLSPQSLVEWVVDGAGSGALALALAATRHLDEGTIVLIDQDETLYPPALEAVGVDLQRLLVVRPRDEAERQWVGEQALRCESVALTLLPLTRLRSQQGRRLQLAVQAGGGCGLLLSPWDARRRACWADARLLVQPRPTPSAPDLARDSHKPPLSTRGSPCNHPHRMAAPSTGASSAASSDRRWHIEVAYRRGGLPGDTFEAVLDHETGRVSLVSELAAATTARRAS